MSLLKCNRISHKFLKPTQTKFSQLCNSVLSQTKAYLMQNLIHIKMSFCITVLKKKKKKIGDLPFEMTFGQ